MIEEDKKKKLYKQIVDQADPYLVLDRMQELGFWPADEPIPEESDEALAERAKLVDELTRLRSKGSKVGDPEAALRKERVRRWQESKKRRAANKAEREQKQKERAEAYVQKKKKTLVHTGDGVSGGLEDRSSNVARLEERGLPVVHSAEELAKAMNMPLKAIRWLTYHRRSVSVVHYRRYAVPKKTGGERHISAPKPILAQAQRWVFEEILKKVDVSTEAHGFVTGRSTLSNAKAHVGKPIVINLDVKDFFPSIGFRRVKGLFRALGYGEAVAITLALLSTEPPRTEAEVDGKVYHVALGDRVLPQGACTSPAITNLICRGLDRDLRGIAERHGYAFTRYADDVTFSGANEAAIPKLLAATRHILKRHSFLVHPDKTRVMRRARRQEVTGLVVNDRAGLSRKERRRLRALLHNVARHGLASQNRNGHPNFPAYLRGHVAYAMAVDPDRAADWKARLERALIRG
ncbi:MAG: reverse transcriptase domain-containing protein [Myxococcota bacterium]